MENNVKICCKRLEEEQEMTPFFSGFEFDTEEKQFNYLVEGSVFFQNITHCPYCGEKLTPISR